MSEGFGGGDCKGFRRSSPDVGIWIEKESKENGNLVFEHVKESGIPGVVEAQEGDLCFLLSETEQGMTL
ncbi:hypothetical protein QJS10_CPA09g00864 [Acorus calamus]|uniref:Uncharacterized protein n=1 Tax=Acorus calamus TaxID=4465 RepID=A0AAV9E7S8_ACOCL|nr:hypothetical protein QJS10_CPA09g00864 [Acorus calamus]